jgi:hypothetical protein
LIAATPAAPPPDDSYLRAWQFLRHATTIDGWSWNGHEPDAAFLNVGEGRFVDATHALGLGFRGDGRAVARVDWDGDLATDVWLAARSAPRLRLLLSAPEPEEARVAFELVGTRSNRQGVGARVEVVAGGRTLSGSVRVGDGYLSSSSKRVTLRLGRGARLDAVRVRWPGGAIESFEGAEAGALWRLVEGRGRAERREHHIERPASRPTPWEPVRAAGAGRIVLDDRLPAGVVELPTLDGAPIPVGASAGSARIVGLGRASDPATGELCAWLGHEREALRAARIEVHALVLPEPGREAAARDLVAAHLPASAAGLADARTALALEVLLVEVLGPFETLPLPLALVFDSAGALALVRAGPTAPRDLWIDAVGVAALAPGERGTEALVGGGRWVRRPERSLGMLADVLERIGRPAWASWYRDVASRRAAR